MNQRREPTISAVAVDRDETSKRSSARRPAISQDDRIPAPQEAKTSPLAVVGLTFGIVGLVVAAMSYWQGQMATQEQVIAQARASQLETRIAELERKLAVF